MAHSIQARNIVAALLDEEIAVDVRLIHRRDGSVDVAVVGPQKMIKLGRLARAASHWRISDVFHEVGRAARCRMSGHFDKPEAAAKVLGLATSAWWKPILANQSIPDELKEAEEPTDAQKEAGNYKKEHRRWESFDISIENARGSERSGTGPDGKTWSVEMPADYGYFRRTEGKDGDHVDCYIGDTEDAHYCYVVDQIDLGSKKFDEHKCLICFPDVETAIETYKKGFSDGKGEQRIGEITTMTVEEFKDWLHDGNTTKPVAWKKTLKESAPDELKRFVMDNPPTSDHVYNAMGEPIRKSRNLRGIRQHISRNLVRQVNIYPLPDGDGVLDIRFNNGDWFRGHWADFGVLKNALRNWRNLYGAPLLINGVPKGMLRYQNPALLEADERQQRRERAKRELMDVADRDAPFREDEKAEIVRALRVNCGKNVQVFDNRVDAQNFQAGEGNVDREEWRFTFDKKTLHYEAWVEYLQRLHSDTNIIFEGESWEHLFKSRPGESPYDFAWRVMDAAFGHNLEESQAAVA